MNPRLIALALIACMGLMVYFTFSGAGGLATDQADRTASVAEGSADEREDKLNELQRQVDSLQERINKGAAVPAGRLPEIELREPSAVELRTNRQRAMGKYEGAFKGGTANPEVDSAMEASALQTALSDRMASLASLPIQPDIDCQGEMCRISGVFATPSAADAWATYYVMEMTDSLPASRYFLESGPDGVRIRLYMFTRAGGRIMAGLDKRP
ncbi:hypothetical protein [Luteimonas mephitis]|jgi:hypothetical protein|uniref:hypothetical protein n=1 Tax=Luteimonas mephitis TaxID=83615 RepID=UPI003A91DD41